MEFLQRKKVRMDSLEFGSSIEIPLRKFYQIKPYDNNSSGQLYPVVMVIVPVYEEMVHPTKNHTRWVEKERKKKKRIYIYIYVYDR